MAASKIRTDHQELAKISAKFQMQAARIEALQRNLRDKAEVLHNGDWVGKGADKFYAELAGSVLPTVKRLEKALERASKVTDAISRVMRQAEDEATALFRGEGEATAGAFGGAGKSLGAALSSFPDVAMTPSPAGPIPIPYPNVGADMTAGIIGSLAQGASAASEAAMAAGSAVAGGVAAAGNAAAGVVGGIAEAAAGAADAGLAAASAAGETAADAAAAAAAKVAKTANKATGAAAQVAGKLSQASDDVIDNLLG